MLAKRLKSLVISLLLFPFLILNVSSAPQKQSTKVKWLELSQFVLNALIYVLLDVGVLVQCG